MTPTDMDHAERPDKSARIITVDFHKDTLFAVERQDGLHVAVTPICNALGLDAKRQRDRIQRDPILREGGTMVALPSAGGIQETFCLRLDLVNGWLFTIDDGRVRNEETRQKVLTYKRECHTALFRHFYGRRDLPLNDPEEADGPKVRMVTEARQTFGTPAAAQLWLELGLPVVPAMLHASGQGELMEFRSPSAA